jgi:hypothetical protein
MALDQRQLTAFHEAGHAVVAWILGQRISSIRIYAESTSEKTSMAGRMRVKQSRYGRYGSYALTTLHTAHKICPGIVGAIDIVVASAGPAAEALFFEQEDEHLLVSAAADLLDMLELLAAMSSIDPGRRNDLLERLVRLSTDYVDRYRKHIEDLANALLANGRIVKAKEIRQILGPRPIPLRKAIEDVMRAVLSVTLVKGGQCGES